MFDFIGAGTDRLALGTGKDGGVRKDGWAFSCSAPATWLVSDILTEGTEEAMARSENEINKIMLHAI